MRVLRDFYRLTQHPKALKGYVSALFGLKTIPVYGYRLRYLDKQSVLRLYRQTVLDGIYNLELGPEPMILDCGSNIGMTMLAFKSRYPAARITAFEPNPLAFTLLERNVVDNGLRDVRLLPYAVGRRHEKITISVDDAMPLAAGMYSRGRKVEVEMQTLSSYITGPVDLLKLDVEGAEGDVLDELSISGALLHVKWIVMEYHHDQHGNHQSLGRTLALLDDHGFRYRLGAYARPPLGKGQQDIMVYAEQR